VNALATHGSGNLIAGGFFDNAGGGSAHNVAISNGSAWAALSGGLAAAPNGWHGVAIIADMSSSNVIGFDTYPLPAASSLFAADPPVADQNIPLARSA
jgi:hypothetical protein